VKTNERDAQERDNPETHYDPRVARACATFSVAWRCARARIRS